MKTNENEYLHPGQRPGLGKRMALRAEDKFSSLRIAQ